MAGDSIFNDLMPPGDSFSSPSSSLLPSLPTLGSTLNPQVLSQVQGQVDKATQAVLGTGNPASNVASSLFCQFIGSSTCTPDDAVGLILGFVLVIAGIFLFKPVRETVITGARAAAVA